MTANKLKSLMVNDEGFAFDPRTGNTYNINATGLVAVGGVKDGATKAQIIATLVDRFDVDEQTADRDLEVFFNELDRNKLIDMEVAS